MAVKTSVRAPVTNKGSTKAVGSASKIVHLHGYLEEAPVPCQLLAEASVPHVDLHKSA